METVISQKNSEPGGSESPSHLEAAVLATDGVLGEVDEVGAEEDGAEVVV